jgi:ABC-type uncharacterized transport system fused permease/ATPase subunit
VAFRAVVRRFALVCAPASVVNAALKAVQIVIQLAFRQRLTTYLHKVYMENRAYYSASVLGGLAHADQRLTDDVEKFCETVAELYSRTFKPALDLVCFTRSLARIIGYKGQAVLYSYFIVVGAALRVMSPPLGLMTAQYSSLNGDFRAAHARVTASAEEIAFNDPPAGRAEMQALNRRLDRMVTHSRLTAFQRFIQSSVDGYATKYTASIIGLVIFALPLYANPNASALSSSVVAGKYINTMRLMMQSSSAMGSLVVVHKRINTLAGYTARVSELLEQVRELGQPNGRRIAFQRAQERVRSSTAAASAAGAAAGDAPSPDSVGRRASGSFSAIADITSARAARTVNGPNVKLEDVSVWSPDGTLLVRDLCLDLPPGASVIIEGTGLASRGAGGARPGPLLCSHGWPSFPARGRQVRTALERARFSESVPASGRSRAARSRSPRATPCASCRSGRMCLPAARSRTSSCTPTCPASSSGRRLCLTRSTRPPASPPSSCRSSSPGARASAACCRGRMF